jgi:hypothetical protein
MKHSVLKKYQIVLLIVVALFFDLLSLIPGANVIVAFVGQAVIAFAFSRCNINIFSVRQSVPYFFASVVEFVPWISFLPAFTLETLIIIFLSRKKRPSVK